MPRKRDSIRILCIQGDCDGHAEGGALYEGLHRLEVKTVYTPCEAISALRSQRFDCVVAMSQPTGQGITKLARRVKDSFGLPFLFNALSEDDRKMSERFVAHDATLFSETLCPGVQSPSLEKEFSTQEKPSTGTLPQYPWVSANGRTVTIHWEGKKEEVWGEEESDTEASEVAAEMESELRATKYVTARLLSLMGSLNDELIDLGVDQQQVENALWDGYRRILGTFAELDNRV